MEEMEKLVTQVKILSETITLQTTRLDQAFKLLEETTARIAETDALLQVTTQALKTSLNESDRAVDDLATMVVALQAEVLKLQQLQIQDSNG